MTPPILPTTIYWIQRTFLSESALVPTSANQVHSPSPSPFPLFFIFHSPSPPPPFPLPDRKTLDPNDRLYSLIRQLDEELQEKRKSLEKQKGPTGGNRGILDITSALEISNIELTSSPGSVAKRTQLDATESTPIPLRKDECKSPRSLTVGSRKGGLRKSLEEYQNKFSKKTKRHSDNGSNSPSAPVGQSNYLFTAAPATKNTGRKSRYRSKKHLSDEFKQPIILPNSVNDSNRGRSVSVTDSNTNPTSYQALHPLQQLFLPSPTAPAENPVAPQPGSIGNLEEKIPEHPIQADSLPGNEEAEKKEGNEAELVEERPKQAENLRSEEEGGPVTQEKGAEKEKSSEGVQEKGETAEKREENEEKKETQKTEEEKGKENNKETLGSRKEEKGSKRQEKGSKRMEKKGEEEEDDSEETKRTPEMSNKGADTEEEARSPEMELSKKQMIENEEKKEQARLGSKFGGKIKEGNKVEKELGMCEKIPEREDEDLKDEETPVEFNEELIKETMRQALAKQEKPKFVKIQQPQPIGKKATTKPKKGKRASGSEEKVKVNIPVMNFSMNSGDPELELTLSQDLHIAKELQKTSSEKHAKGKAKDKSIKQSPHLDAILSPRNSSENLFSDHKLKEQKDSGFSISYLFSSMKKSKVPKVASENVSSSSKTRRFTFSTFKEGKEKKKEKKEKKDERKEKKGDVSLQGGVNKYAMTIDPSAKDPLPSSKDQKESKRKTTKRRETETLGNYLNTTAETTSTKRSKTDTVPKRGKSSSKYAFTIEQDPLAPSSKKSDKKRKTPAPLSLPIQNASLMTDSLLSPRHSPSKQRKLSSIPSEGSNTVKAGSNSPLASSVSHSTASTKKHRIKRSADVKEGKELEAESGDTKIRESRSSTSKRKKKSSSKKSGEELNEQNPTLAEAVGSLLLTENDSSKKKKKRSISKRKSTSGEESQHISKSKKHRHSTKSDDESVHKVVSGPISTTDNTVVQDAASNYLNTSSAVEKKSKHRKSTDSHKKKRHSSHKDLNEAALN